MKRRSLYALGSLLVLLVALTGQNGLARSLPPSPQHVTPVPAPKAAHPAGNIPPGLPTNFWLGLANSPQDRDWMTNSGVPWDMRYQYLTGGVNTADNWSTWWPGNGGFARNYIDDSRAVGYFPTFSYYQIFPSQPHIGATEAEIDYNNLNNPATMAAYYADFALLMQRCAEAGGPVLIQVEPDLWGYMEQRVTNGSNNAADISAAVSSSGYPAVAGYPNTVQGFAWALLHLRDTLAPNVLLAIHPSHWVNNDIASDPDPTINAAALGARTAHFIGTAGVFNNPAGLSHWDLAFVDPINCDADWYRIVQGQPTRWWDINDATFPNFARYRSWVAAVNAGTGLRVVLWQLPMGNTAMRSENNTTGHYQDNRSVYFLGNNAPHLQEWMDAGVIGLLWGNGLDGCTTYTDARGDGITNPAPINGNNGVATVSDDDGGYLRTQSGAYYGRGALPLPAAVPPCGLFYDVPPDSWPAPYIQYLACRGIINGYGETFRPFATTTRGQLCKIISNGLQWPLVTPPTPTFADVDATNPFYAFIETAAVHGVINGYGCGGPGEPCDGGNRPYFRPNNSVTRAQLSKIIVSAKGWALGNPASPTFNDVPASSPFYGHIEAAVAHGIISGYGCGGAGEPCPGLYFRPGATATRAQLSKITYNALTQP